MMHKDVYRTLLGDEMVYRRVKVLAADDPDEGGRPGSYLSAYITTTEPHEDADCPWRDGDDIPVERVPVDPDNPLAIPGA